MSLASPAAVVGLVAMLAATLAVGVFARRYARTTSDFLVAARSVRPAANAAAISGEYLSAASFLGIAGLVMKFGYDVLWYPVGYAAGYLILLIFIAGPLRRFGAYTIPDFAEGRFNSPRFRRLAVAMVILIGLFYTLPQMKAAGITVAAAVGVPYAVGVGVIAAVVVAIVTAGGMRGVTLVQAMQFAVKLFAISVPVFVLLIHFGTPAGIFHSVESSGTSRLQQPARVGVAAGDAWTVPAETRVGLSHPTTVRVLPDRSGQYVGAPRAQAGPEQGERLLALAGDARLPAARIVWTEAEEVALPAGAIAPYGSGTPATTTSAWLRPFGPLAGGSGQPLLFTYSLMVAILCGTMGLPHILVRFYTNPDARAARRTAWLVLILVSLFYLWPPMYGVLGRLQAAQLYTSNLTDTVVLFLPGQLQPGWLGDILSGVTAAGAFAAFTATLSGLLVSLAGALGHDIYGRWLRPDASTQARSRAFRVGAVVAGGVAAALGLVVEHFDISILVGWAFAIAASSFFPLLVLGIWWPRLTTSGAALGAAIGGGVATISIVATMLGSASADVEAFLASHSWLAVTAAQPAIVTIPLAFSVMIGVSTLRADLPQGVAAKMLQLHVPDRLGLRRDYIRD